MRSSQCFVSAVMVIWSSRRRRRCCCYAWLLKSVVVVVGRGSWAWLLLFLSVFVVNVDGR